MAAWRNTYACSDVNDDESLNSECEDEVLSSEQLEISTESDLSECSSVSTAKSKSSSSRKAGRKAVWQEKVITDMVDIICSSEYLNTNLSSKILSVPETCVSQRRLGTSQQLLRTMFESTVALQLH